MCTRFGVAVSVPGESGDDVLGAEFLSVSSPIKLHPEFSHQERPCLPWSVSVPNHPLTVTEIHVVCINSQKL